MNSNSLVLTLLSLDGWGQKQTLKYVTKCGFDYKLCVERLITLSDDKKIEFKSKLKLSNKIIKENELKGIKMISLLDENFPKRLYSSTDVCVFLFYKGNIELLNSSTITIIGTRNPNSPFIDKGKIVSKYFAQKGYTIVSGLAIGCDTIAHIECVNIGGKTIAVLPSPCDEPKPDSNKNLANKILEADGLLISEYGTGSPVSKYNFPRRDRIQSLLSNVTLVIQASNTSGTMIAVKKSLKENKTIYALEGNHIEIIDKYIDVNNFDDLHKIEKEINRSNIRDLFDN